MSDLRRNVLALGLDYGLFMVGLAFASQTTILPAFAAWLGAPNVLIGAIPAVMTLGWFLPQLFMAAHTATLPRKLPFVIRWTIVERLPFPALALVSFLLAERAPAAALVLTLAMLLVMTVMGGVADAGVARHHRPRRAHRAARAAVRPLRAGGRPGRLRRQCADGGTRWRRCRRAAGYGLCFVGASVCMALSYVALLYVREPVGGPVAPPVALRAHLARVPGLLRRDRNLSWFLAARAMAIVGQMAMGFYTVYALRAWAGAGVAGGGVHRAAGRRHGRRHAGVCLAGGPRGPSARHPRRDGRDPRRQRRWRWPVPRCRAYGLVFVLAGVQQAAFSVSNMAVLLEFAPSVDERPIYVGLGATSLAPFAFAAPLIAGLLADALGFRAVFVRGQRRLRWPA